MKGFLTKLQISGFTALWRCNSKTLFTGCRVINVQTHDVVWKLLPSLGTRLCSSNYPTIKQHKSDINTHITQSSHTIWSFVRGRIGVLAYRIWWLYTALQLLYKQSPKTDCIVRNLQFSDTIFISLQYRKAIPQQVLLWIANSTQVDLQISAISKAENLSFTWNKCLNISLSDNWSLTL